MLTLIIFLILLIFILLGVPIAVSMSLTAIIIVIYLGDFSILPMLAQRMYASTTSFTLLAIPFFILAGNLMNTGGVTRRIFNFAKALVGFIPGGLGHVNVVGNIIFSGMSGSAIADAVGLGQIQMKAMIDNGYDRKFSAALTSAASTIGPIIPPSIPFVLYGALADVSVSRLFLAGFIPGFMMGLALMIAVFIISVIRKYPKEKFSGFKIYFKELFFSFFDAFLSLLTPMLIIGGILSGKFTPTEASVAATLYALFLGFLYREIKISDLPKIFWNTIIQTVKLMFIIAAAGFLGWLLIHQSLPDKMILALTTISADKNIIILFIIIIVLILGFFIEGNAIFLITIPLFMPIVHKFSIDPVQFGVIMTLGIMIGNLTPPVGMCLFAVSSISKVSVNDIVSEIWPYLLGITIVWLLVAYIPDISLVLPNLLYGTGGQ